MAELTDPSLAPDFGLIERGDMRATADAISLIYARLVNVLQILASSGGLPDPLPAVSGVNLTNLNASNLASGTIPAARLSGYLNLLEAKTGDTEVVNTVVETTVFTKTVIAGTMGTDKGLILVLSGNTENNSGGTRSPNIKIKFGGTTILDGVAFSIADGSARSSITILVFLFAQGATNAQIANTLIFLGTSDDADGGAIGAGVDYQTGFARSLAIDSTVNQDVVVTITNDLAHANFSVRIDGGRLFRM